MTLIFRPARVEDITAFPLQTAQNIMEPIRLKPGYGEQLLRVSDALAAEYEGRVIGVAGVAAVDTALGQAWLLTGGGFPVRLWPAIVRRVLAFLHERSTVFPVIQAAVTVDFKQGHRLCHMLDFALMGLRPARGDYPAAALYYRTAGKHRLPTVAALAALLMESAVGRWLDNPEIKPSEAFRIGPLPEPQATIQ